MLPGVLSVQSPFSPSSPFPSSLIIIAPPSEVASQEALADCELSNSAVMEVESGVNLDIRDPEFIHGLSSRSELNITEPISTFAEGAYQRGRAIDCLREFKGRGPSSELVPVPSLPAQLSLRQLVCPAAQADFLEEGSAQRAQSVGPRGNGRKRIRRQLGIRNTEAMDVDGAEESKGEPSALMDEESPTGSEPTLPPQEEAPRQFPVLDALRRYNILVDGAREGGPDFIPCEWSPDMLIQDIP